MNTVTGVGPEAPVEMRVCLASPCTTLVSSTRAGYCHSCYQRWWRAGKPASGPPAPRYWRRDPTRPRLCTGCGDTIGRRGGPLCQSCRHRQQAGLPPRTAVQVAHDQAVRQYRGQPRPCQDCGQSIAQMLRCGPCRDWRREHRGADFPRGVPAGLRAGWVEVPGLGWVPPAGYCAPGETYGQVAGCQSCAYQADCAAMSLAVAS